MPPIPHTFDTGSLPESKWGASAKYDFDNEAKWYTVKNVPLLDEHIMTDDDGKPVAHVRRNDLIEISRNNNNRVRETGDPATLILGHTSDDPQAPEKPAKGFAVNYKVLPFKRDPKTGKIIYAVHSDYKLRHKHAHLIEDFPRRSVELWWNKKELDPIALLGGTTPERDLGVVMRMSRLRHVAMLGGSTPSRDLGASLSDLPWDGALRFSRRGASIVEMYQIEDVGVSSNKSKKYSHKGVSAMPAMPKKYAMNDGGMGDGSDQGDDGMFDQPQDDQSGQDTDLENDGTGDQDMDGDAEADPMVQRVMQSKPFKAMQSKLDMILQALQEQGGGGGAPPGGGDDDGMSGAPDEMGAGAPVGAAGGQDDGMGGQPPEMDDRRDHGDQPVQFSQTGFAGPGSTSVPSFAGGTTGKRYQRPATSGSSTVSNNPELIKMRRRTEALEKSNAAMVMKLARADAEKQINALEREGVIFGDTPEEHEQGKVDETEFLTLLNDEDRPQQVSVMRSRYKRKRPDPANPANPGVARFSRTAGNSDPSKEEEEDEFDPQDPQEACDYVACQTDRGMSKPEAIKFMRKRTGHK